MVGRTTIVIEVAEFATPPGVVTETTPASAPTGTLTVTFVALTVAGTAVTPPMNETTLAPVRFVPLIVRVAPTAIDVGEMLVIVGAGTLTVNGVAVTVTP